MSGKTQVNAKVGSYSKSVKRVFAGPGSNPSILKLVGEAERSAKGKEYATMQYDIVMTAEGPVRPKPKKKAPKLLKDIKAVIAEQEAEND